MENEKAILEAWQQNGVHWIESVEREEIESRKLGTNEAIIQAILKLDPKKVLDMGCGEGWICREMTSRNIANTGMDGAADLIDYANDKGDGNFIMATYEELINGTVHLIDTFDLIVFNYALFGKQNTYDILEHSISFLNPGGNILIQTIHPDNNIIADHSESMWMTEKWNGFDPSFKPYDWYFRTKEDWIKVFAHTGLYLKEEQNIFLPSSSSPFSIIYHIRKK